MDNLYFIAACFIFVGVPTIAFYMMYVYSMLGKMLIAVNIEEKERQYKSLCREIEQLDEELVRKVKELKRDQED
ncbi:MAG: hypothetical protein OXI36_01195 [Gammaproteobacteria bacterium]|nr:hypothetical protein [Gammaproteobacteria bacterium]MDE0402030.1 hypothetical protein [Gammaproteobacteria bacterium]